MGVPGYIPEGLGMPGYTPGCLGVPGYPGAYTLLKSAILGCVNRATLLVQQALRWLVRISFPLYFYTRWLFLVHSLVVLTFMVVVVPL